MHFLVLTLFTLSSSLLTSALNITYPVAGATVSNKLNFHITWTANSSDPARLNIVLTNDDNDSINLGTNISSLARAYTVDSPIIKSQAWTGNDFEVIINSAGDLGNGLLAISGKFTITNSTDTSPMSTGSSSGTSTSNTATAAATSSGIAAGIGAGRGVLGAVAAGMLLLSDCC